MQKNSLSITRALLVAVFVVMLLPLTSFAQRRWVVVRPRRSRIVVYQPRSYITYQPRYSSRQYYSYPQQSFAYSYSQPYYSNGYYSYGYTQPYYVNRYTYSQVYPTYNYRYSEYRPRYRRSRIRVGIWLR